MVGVLVAVGLGAIISMALPADVLTAEVQRFMWAGVLAGALSGSVGNLLIARGGLGKPERPEDSRAFLRSIVLDFALQTLAVVGGTLGLFLLSVKFPNLAAFGLALAGVATVCRVMGTVMVSRALNDRARANRMASGVVHASPATSVQDSNS